MSITVLMQAHIPPQHITATLAVLHERLEPQAQRSNGRLRERIFQRLGSDGELLSLSEWQTAEASEAASATLRAGALQRLGHGPLRVHRLVRLLSFERPLQRAEVTACALIVPTHGDSPAVRERVVRDRAELRDAPGLISHEIYITSEPPITYVSIHSWRQLADLERFRNDAGSTNEQRLAEVGATLERFTGALIAEYPLITSNG